MDWDYKSHPPVDVFWAGIPCTTFSTASTKPQPEVGNVLALRTLQILEHFQKLNKNIIWAIEIPKSSLLRKQSFMQGLPHKFVDYCQYSNPSEGFGYKKPTVIFGNIEWIPKTCPGTGKCANMQGIYHLEVAQRGPARAASFTKALP